MDRFKTLRKWAKRFLFALPLLLAFCAPGAFAQCPTQTPNVGFQIPNIGNTTTWGLCLNGDLSTLDNLLGGTATFPVGTATAPINQHANWITANVAPQVVTNITGGYSGQTISIFCGVSDTFTSIVSSATISLSGPFACPGSMSISLTYIGTVWTEVGRSASFVTWDQIRSALGNLTLANTTFNTTFNQTTPAVWTWANVTPATNVANQNSPILVLAGTGWDGALSQLDKWTVQGMMAAGPTPLSTFTIGHSGPGAALVLFNGVKVQGSGTMEATLIQGDSQGFFTFNTGLSGSVKAVTSVANSVGSLATYQGSFVGAGNPSVGEYTTIAGFTTGANNGHFIVQGSNSTSVTVYNSGAVSETHAATSTVDFPYYNNDGGFNAGFGFSSNTYAISGTNYIPIAILEALTAQNPNLILNAKGNSVDSEYFRIINDGATGNHGLEIGSIIDGTGATPVIFQIGHFGGGPGAVWSVGAGNIAITATNVNFSGSVAAGTVSATQMGLGTGVGLHTLKVNVSSASLLALPGTPVVLLTTPGANSMFIVSSFTYQYRFVSTPYTIGNPGNFFTIVYHGDTTALAQNGAAVGLVDQGSNHVTWNTWAQPNVNLAQTVAVNHGLDLTLQGTTPGLTLGDGTLEVVIEYSVLDLS